MHKKCWVWSIVLICSWAGMAQAASISALRKQARALYQEGRALALKKQYTQANEKYTQALALVRKARSQARRKKDKEGLRRSEASFLFIIGRTHHLNGAFGPARKLYLRCIKMNPPPRVELQARRFLQTLPRPLGNMVALRINAIPLHASISLHNSRGEGRFGRIPFTARIKAGIYQIEISAAGYLPRKVTLRLKPGTRVQRSFQLEPKGQKARKKPPVRVAKVRKPPPAPKQSWHGPVMWAGAGVAGISLVTAVGLLVGASQNFGEASEMRKGLTRFPTANQNKRFFEEADQGHRLQSAGIALMVVAGVVGTGALIIGLTRPKQAPPPKPDAPPAQGASPMLWLP